MLSFAERQKLLADLDARRVTLCDDLAQEDV